MEVTIGKEGLSKTWQAKFPEEDWCCRCGGTARIGFVAHEGIDDKPGARRSISSLHKNEGRGSYWLHDYCAVAIYFCRDCLEATARYNQG